MHALSGAYAVDALDPGERVRFELHLAHCAECRSEVDGLREAAARLGSGADVAPPPALRGDVLAAIETVRPLPPLTAAGTSVSSQSSESTVPLVPSVSGVSAERADQAERGERGERAADAQPDPAGPVPIDRARGRWARGAPYLLDRGGGRGDRGAGRGDLAAVGRRRGAADADGDRARADRGRCGPGPPRPSRRRRGNARACPARRVAR